MKPCWYTIEMSRATGRGERVWGGTVPCGVGVYGMVAGWVATDSRAAAWPDMLSGRSHVSESCSRDPRTQGTLPSHERPTCKRRRG